MFFRRRDFLFGVVGFGEFGLGFFGAAGFFWLAEGMYIWGSVLGNTYM